MSDNLSKQVKVTFNGPEMAFLRDLMVPLECPNVPSLVRHLVRYVATLGPEQVPPARLPLPVKAPPVPQGPAEVPLEVPVKALPVLTVTPSVLVKASVVPPMAFDSSTFLDAYRELGGPSDPAPSDETDDEPAEPTEPTVADRYYRYTETVKGVGLLPITETVWEAVGQPDDETGLELKYSPAPEPDNEY